MKILKWILITVVLIIAAYLLFSITQSNKLELSESIIINSSKEQVYAEIINFDTWNQWAAWNKMDANMKTEITGEPGKVGAKSQWWSNHKYVGDGQQEIVEVRENEYMKVKMFFGEWKEPNYASFILEDVENGTKVTWSFDGAKTPFYMNAMNTYMKPMLIENYKKSLLDLKEVVESKPAPKIENPMNLEIIELEPTNIISIKDSTTADRIASKLTELYTELSIYVASTEGLEADGQPLAIYYSYSPEKVVMEGAMQYTGAAKENGRIMVKQTPAGKTIKGIHYGKYASSGEMHNAIEDFGKANNMEFREMCWEVYANDPTLVDSADVETHIYYPVK